MYYVKLLWNLFTDLLIGPVVSAIPLRSIIYRYIGFIADIYSIIGKYDLSAYISNFIETDYNPPKMIWKRLVQRNVDNVFKSHFKSRTHANPAMNRFISIHPDCLKPLRLWTATKVFPRSREQLSSLALLCTIIPTEVVCSLCEQRCIDIDSIT